METISYSLDLSDKRKPRSLITLPFLRGPKEWWWVAPAVFGCAGIVLIIWNRQTVPRPAVASEPRRDVASGSVPATATAQGAVLQRSFAPIVTRSAEGARVPVQTASAIHYFEDDTLTNAKAHELLKDDDAWFASDFDSGEEGDGDGSRNPIGVLRAGVRQVSMASLSCGSSMTWTKNTNSSCVGTDRRPI
jgi:hypothetical protein